MKPAESLTLAYTDHRVNGVILHVGHLGPVEGEFIVFLHGFPEFSQSWIRQAEFFANQGYHVVVPDQRGYNLSTKPISVEDYALKYLADDLAALITSLTSRPVAVVEHDWGGGVAWALAQRQPGLIKKLIILNMPHPQVMKDNLLTNPIQILKSWYVFFFQLPFVPEQICSAFNFKWLEMTMVKTARPGAFSPAYITACKHAWRHPDAMSSMINWYRAFKNPGDTDIDIQAPVLILWGKKDSFLTIKLAPESIKRCYDGQLIFLENATHWLHHEEPALVNQHILTFLQA